MFRGDSHDTFLWPFEGEEVDLLKMESQYLFLYEINGSESSEVQDLEISCLPPVLQILR
jgi:hypothetical protein